MFDTIGEFLRAERDPSQSDEVTWLTRVRETTIQAGVVTLGFADTLGKELELEEAETQAKAQAEATVGALATQPLQAVETAPVYDILTGRKLEEDETRVAAAEQQSQPSTATAQTSTDNDQVIDIEEARRRVKAA